MLCLLLKKKVANVLKIFKVQVTEIFDLTRDENSAADDGGIEMDNSHWDLQREMQTRPWSLNMRNDSISKYESLNLHNII